MFEIAKMFPETLDTISGSQHAALIPTLEKTAVVHYIICVYIFKIKNNG